MMKRRELSGFFFSLSFFFQIRVKTPSVLDGKPHFTRRFLRFFKKRIESSTNCQSYLSTSIPSCFFLSPGSCREKSRTMAIIV
ncbi:hypothetical protein ARMGADRAFT_797158 [Armillaria gallica]|uniref:Uncharacterized protein n=1 Tax=Armillaria gallica TaxID=47427 RepID=A0A2H3DJE0_ARMGA|nr:hypothetical protein ARMGADRAFT_797158 [Armillaria gallica]